MKLITKTTAAAAVAAALLLSGCSGTEVFSGASKAPVESAATAAPTPEPIDGDENGDGKLSEREKELIAKRSYTLLDGTVVPTPKQGEAIPEVIIENIRALVAPMTEDMARSSAGASDAAMMDVIEREESLLAKKIIMVNLIVEGSCQCERWAVWTLNGPVVEPVASKDAAVAAANSHAARVAKYQVIIFD